jgi:hypothetical protein
VAQNRQNARWDSFGSLQLFARYVGDSQRQRKEEEVAKGEEESIYKALLLALLLCFHSSSAHLPLPEELKVKEFFHCPLFFGLMTASMPKPSLSWNRVLPAPHALLNGNADDKLSRRSSSLLQHHLFSSRDLVDSSRDRRSTVPSISYQLNPSNSTISPAPSLAAQDFTTASQPVSGPLTRKRAASLMADEAKSRETSPATTHESISEATNQFCLCQPDPKIPRPRNGTFILSHCSKMVTS